jgi:hypothetical protein
MKKLIAVLAIAAFAIAANAHCGKCEGDKAKDHKCTEACKDKCSAAHKCTDACKEKCAAAHKDDKKK